MMPDDARQIGLPFSETCSHGNRPSGCRTIAVIRPCCPIFQPNVGNR